MAQYVTEALILSVRNWGEADKMVTFFSREFGKITAVAYGCRRPRSPLAGGMQVFSHLQLQVMSGNSLDTIKQCETKQTFKHLREDLDCMAYAAFVAEVAADVCPERHPEPHIYDVLLSAFQLFSKRNPRLVALAAGYQILECTGSQPNYDICANCGKAIQADACFSFIKGGIICDTCKESHETLFSMKMRDLIKQLLMLDWQNPQEFSVSGSSLMQVEKLLIDYLHFILEKPLKSLDFIHQLAILPKVNHP